MITVPASYRSRSPFKHVYGTFFAKAEGPDEVVREIRRDLGLCLRLLPFEPESDADAVAYMEAVREAFIDEFEYHRMHWGPPDEFGLAVVAREGGLAFPFEVRWTRSLEEGCTRDECLEHHVLTSAFVYDRETKTLSVEDGQHASGRGADARALDAPSPSDDTAATGEVAPRERERSSKFAYTSPDQIRIRPPRDEG